MLEKRSEAGVRVYEDHRDNLVIDVHNDLVLGRAAEMRSEHSEAALLWNVFRTLEKLDAGLWLPRLARHAFPEARRAGRFDLLLGRADLAAAEFHWWSRWDVPQARHAWLRDAAQSGRLNLEHYAPRSIPEKRTEVERRLAAEQPFEDPVEIPLCIETPAWMLGIEAVYKGNLRRHTTYDSRRDAVLRLVDAGTHAAAARGKRFLSLVLCTDPRVVNLETGRLVDRYRSKPEHLVEALPHRDDAAVLEQAARSIGLVRWKDLGALLIDAKARERSGQFDVTALDELIKYLARKEIGFNFFRRLK